MLPPAQRPLAVPPVPIPPQPQAQEGYILLFDRTYNIWYYCDVYTSDTYSQRPPPKVVPEAICLLQNAIHKLQDKQQKEIDDLQGTIEEQQSEIQALQSIVEQLSTSPPAKQTTTPPPKQSAPPKERASQPLREPSSYRPPKPQTCLKCSTVFPSGTALHKHLPLCEPFRCTKCGSTFRSNNSLHQHLEQRLICRQNRILEKEKLPDDPPTIQEEAEVGEGMGIQETSSSRRSTETGD